MTASAELLAALVSTALVVTACAPILLIAWLIRDWRRGKLW